MKKTLAIVLVLLMALTLFACEKTTPSTATQEPSKPPATSTDSGGEAPASAPEEEQQIIKGDSIQPNTGKYGDDPLDKVGFYDPNYDYSKNPEKWTIQYMAAASGPLYDVASNAFALWCKKMNMEYSPMWSSGGDNDAFITNISTFINQGVDAFILDPDANSYMRIKEIIDEAGCHWMGFMSPAYNMEAEGTPMIHPSVGFDHYWFGQQMGLKMDEWMKEKWADVPREEIGYIAVDWSAADVLHYRVSGAQDAFLEKNPDMADRFFIADTLTATAGPTLDGANQVVTAVLSEHPEITHWLCSTLFDDTAMGADAALDSMGFDKDTAVVTTVGGTSIQRQWDNGIESCWQLSIFTPQTIYAEPVVGALHAFLTGQATPETIWPSWINKSDPKSGTYASMLLPSYWMDITNYKALFEWSDIYADANEYDYDPTGLTRDSFNTRMDIPDYFAG